MTGVGRKPVLHSAGAFSYFQGNIQDPETFKKLPRDFNLVINLAGVQPSILSREQAVGDKRFLRAYVDNNLRGMINVLEYIDRCEIPQHIFASTHREMESHWRNGVLVPQDALPSINNKGDHADYAISKLAAGLMSMSYAQAANFSSFVVRLPMMFMIPENPYYLSNGKHQVMPFLEIIRRAIAREQIEVFGDPELKRDYVHVRNFAKLCLAIYLDKPGSRALNLGTGEGVTTQDFVIKLASAFVKRDDDISPVFRPEVQTYKSAMYEMESLKTVLPSFELVKFNEMVQLLRNDFVETKAASRWGWGS